MDTLIIVLLRLSDDAPESLRNEALGHWNMMSPELRKFITDKLKKGLSFIPFPQISKAKEKVDERLPVG